MTQSFDALLDEDELAAVGVVRSLEAAIAPLVARIDASAHAPQDLMRQAYAPLFEAGLQGTLVSPGSGGLGLGSRAVVVLLEELARIDAGLCLGMLATQNGLRRIEGSAMDSVRGEILEAALADTSGEWLVAGATTEEQRGSDSLNFHRNVDLTTRATSDADGLRLDGTKWASTNASIANIVLVTYQTEPDLGFVGRETAVVFHDASGLFLDDYEMDGLRCCTHTSLTLTGVHVDTTHRLKRPPVTSENMRQVYAAGVAGHAIQLGAITLGIATAALAEARRYAEEREQGGSFLRGHERVRDRLSEAQGSTFTARAALWQCCALEERGALRLDEAVAARSAALSAAERCTTLALEMLASRGALRESRVSKLLRDLSAIRVAAGTLDFMRRLAITEN